jgi:hypothetical protein
VRTAVQLATTAVALSLVLSSGGRAAAPKFYPDDPIARDPETQNASAITPIPVSEQYDFVENSFLGAGERVDKHAVNTNTIDEVPDSSWFTNRAGRPGWGIPEMLKGPDTVSGPSPMPWTIVAAKSEGITPGLTIRDKAGDTYFIKFDPPSNPEMASGAELISTRFFHAFGFNVPENYIAHMRADGLIIGEGATVTDVDGRRQRMRQRDIDALLKKAAKHPDGSYRVLASRRLEGTDVGRFRYYGTRPDDPNDIFPHEHRRELRGLLVFAAWLNHDDSRSVNTFDALVRQGARSIVRHHLIDFGSTLGSGSTQAQTTRAGNEYIWEARPTLITMLTLGFYVRPWVKVDYPEYPAIGRIESNYFLPQAWKPEYPNPAFLNARADDRFWAARIMAAFSDEAVRAIVETAKYSDRGAADYLTETLLARKSKILMSWLNGVNPLVKPALSASGELTFENAAEEAGVAKAAERYTIGWSRFDNDAGTHEPFGDEQTVTERRAQAPERLLASGADYISARVRAFHPDRPEWSQPVQLYFRRASATGSGQGAAPWTLVGLERLP